VHRDQARTKECFHRSKLQRQFHAVKIHHSTKLIQTSVNNPWD